MMDTGPFSKFWGAGGPSIETMRQSRPWSEDLPTFSTPSFLGTKDWVKILYLDG